MINQIVYSLFKGNQILIMTYVIQPDKEYTVVYKP